MFNKIFPSNSLVEVTIGSGGVLALSVPGNYIVNAESGTTDDLTQITGLQEGDEVTLSPKSTDTITVKDGTYMIIGGDRDFVMDDEYDNIKLFFTAPGYCREQSRVSNG